MIDEYIDALRRYHDSLDDDALFQACDQIYQAMSSTDRALADQKAVDLGIVPTWEEVEAEIADLGIIAANLTKLMRGEPQN